MSKKFFIFIITCLFISGIFISSAFSQKEDFLNGYWSFDEEGDTVKDQSGNGNDGEINGEVEWVEGKVGKALKFSLGANIEISDSDTLRDMEEYTIAMWFKLNDFAAGWSHIFEKDGSYGITINTDTGDFRYTPNSSQIWVESKYKVEKDTWYYITMIHDGSKASFFVNGTKESEADEPLVFTPNPINIAHSAPYTVDGVIDEVKFWAKSLASNEINIAMKGQASVNPSKENLSTVWGKIKRNIAAVE